MCTFSRRKQHCLSSTLSISRHFTFHRSSPVHVVNSTFTAERGADSRLGMDMRKPLARTLLAVLMLGGAAISGIAPAHADDWGISVGVGAPGWDGYYDDGRPCWWYRSYNLPAPRRCYSYFYGIWGPSLYLDGDFIFRDRDNLRHWHDRADYRHWRDHDFHWRGNERRSTHDV